jgi:hypothetical protein
LARALASEEYGFIFQCGSKNKVRAQQQSVSQI